MPDYYMVLIQDIILIIQKNQIKKLQQELPQANFIHIIKVFF